MGKIKTDDKSSLSGNYCRTEVRCMGDNARSSVIPSKPKKSRSDDVKLPKNNLNDETIDQQSVKVKGDSMSKDRENRTTSSRSMLRKITKNKVAEIGKEIFKTKVKEVKESVISSVSKSEVTSSKQLMIESSQCCPDDERPAATPLKRTGIPSVHIQRLNSNDPVLLSHSNKHDYVEQNSVKTVFTNTEAKDLSEGNSKKCPLLLDASHFHELSVKPDCHSSLVVDNQKSDSIEIKEEKDEKDYVDCNSTQAVDIAGVKRRSGKSTTGRVAIPLLAKFGEELKFPMQSSDLQTKCCKTGGDEGLTEDKQSNVVTKITAASDDSCNDVVVVSVDSSRSKIARKSRSDANRKRSGTDDSCSVTATSIKQEPCVEQNALAAEIGVHESCKVDKLGFIYDTPNKMARPSSKKIGAKSAKKARPAKSKQSTFPGSNASPSILTRSMIKIPGLSTSSMFELATTTAKKRRVTESEIWLNRRLEQQACLLWSSEQKRRFQQQYPDSPSDVIDDAMRRHWESLGDRDRHRYLQRARSAMAVERGRQLGRRALTQLSSRDEHASTADTLPRRLHHYSVEQLSALFDSATAEQQSEIIRHKLRALQRRLAPEDYATLTHLFRDNLRLAATDHPPPGTRDSASSPRRSSQSAADVCRGRMEALARRVMFATVREVESRLDEILARRRAYVAQQTVIQYHALLSSLIHHAGEFESGHPDDGQGYFSAHLDQLLHDLADVDRDVSGSDGDCRGWSERDRDAVLAMASELSLGWFAGSTNLSVAGQRIVVPNVVDLCCQKLLLYSATMSPCVTQLSVLDVDEQLNIIHASSDVGEPPRAAWPVSDIILTETAGHVYRLHHGLERCCGLDSPSCVLSGLVLYDRLCRLHQHASTGTQQRARRQKVTENRGQSAADPAGTQKTVDQGEQEQSTCEKPRPADKSSPDSG